MTPGGRGVSPRQGRPEPPETVRPAVVLVGTTVQLHFQLRDFDGEDRTDNRDVALIVEAVPGTFTLVNGQLDLNLDLLASGAFAVTSTTTSARPPVGPGRY